LSGRHEEEVWVGVDLCTQTPLLIKAYPRSAGGYFNREYDAIKRSHMFDKYDERLDGKQYNLIAHLCLFYEAGDCTLFELRETMREKKVSFSPLESAAVFYWLISEIHALKREDLLHGSIDPFNIWVRRERYSNAIKLHFVNYFNE
jgi:hypothetical protein